MENEKDKSPFEIKNVTIKDEFNLDVCIVSDEDKKTVVSILKSLKNYSVQGALELLDVTKRVLIECTKVHDEYN